MSTTHWSRRGPTGHAAQAPEAAIRDSMSGAEALPGERRRGGHERAAGKAQPSGNANGHASKQRPR
eukprot:CAMPEP_0185208058 /NCGR_PEP_ID=MMETSP1140-20130426/61356_1 /TAXON_ID=298111 /ORGANISM="Pavlova sp., Strain CCMP459" /LENGTH=65 /DNA_ID=CAMNT_0027775769 /DNA_START=78 /DNA_END=272 /DNA_ORIENTATION=-